VLIVARPSAEAAAVAAEVAPLPEGHTREACEQLRGEELLRVLPLAERLIALRFDEDLPPDWQSQS